MAIETGRHAKPKVPVQDRLCNNCVVVEDELHHLIECDKYDLLRTSLYAKVTKHIQNFERLQPRDKFIQLLQSKVLAVQASIGTFLIQASSAP